MKISTLITLAGAAALVFFGGHAMSTFGDTLTNTADTATTQQVSGISEGFDAAFAIADN